jgi:glucose 1-dehydrogenase
MCSREVIKKMLLQRKKEKISDYSVINISSVHEITPSPFSAPYGASKGGMEMLTKTMTLEVADNGIRINGIAPGAIATMMNIDKLENKKKMEEEEKRIPMHRMAKPSEIAKVALFLASEASSYMLGTTIFVDGGLTLVS